MRLSWAGLLAVCFLALSGAGCSCGGPPGVEPDGGVQQDGGQLPDGGTSDGGTDGGPQLPACANLGEGCAASGVNCCQGVCAPSGMCETLGQTACSKAGETCNSASDCCDGRTCGSDGKCSASQCLQTGASCTQATAGQCCTLTCGANGQCADVTTAPTLPGGSTATCINSATKVIGQSCTSAMECCSNNCQGGICTRSFFCQATGDLCTANDDCCSGRCSSTDGTTAGRCFESTGGRLVDGSPCTSGGECASRICTDLGFGAKVCTPASGCSVTDNACATSDECCGGKPLGSVDCIDNKCNQGTACNEVGMVCGKAPLPDGGQVTVNAPAPNKCCDDIGGNSCKLDSAGVPRCFGGASTQCPTGYTGEAGCCIAAEQQCRFSDQCCDGKLCLPNADGGVGYTCQGVTCDPVGTTCNPDAGTTTCCAGTQCLPAFAGELSTGYACQVPVTPVDGGTTDAGTTPSCRANTAQCTAGSECCSGICTGGMCAAPATCQPQGGTCTSGADCCSGFQCAQDNTGKQTCQPGGCSSAGQSCTGQSQCCSGLSCTDSNGGACNGTSACACTVIIG